ncbi:MAG: ABC transporter ATP-binding protein [Deltaproteobacteria bacterium]|nr:ABC transporter ATP-binding protein [Deltaproteobacteria bacterium]
MSLGERVETAKGSESGAGPPGEPGALTHGHGGQPDVRGARVEARAVGRRFGPHVALADVGFDIHPGETFGLLGPNGAGKTTFIRLLTGFLMPSAGEVRVDGLSPVRDTRAVQARIGYVPEQPRLYPELRVAGFLRFAAELRGLVGAARNAAVEASLARFGLEPVAKRLIGHLSKGFRQRVSLAQGFLHDPTLLIVDEPTSGLDPLQREEVRDLLLGLRDRCTIVLCTHDLRDAQALATRCAVLQRGRLVALGGTDSLLGGDDPLALFRVDAGAESAAQGGR